MTDRKRGAPTPLKDVVPTVLGESGLAERLEQAAVIVNWAAIVGREIAKVAQPISIDKQGVLQVAVTNNAWMTELSLMGPELLRAINEKVGSRKVQRIRWRLVR